MTVIICLLLFTAGASIGYFVGLNHGHEAGEIRGEIAERQRNALRVIQVTAKATGVGRIIGRIEANCGSVFSPHERN